MSFDQIMTEIASGLTGEKEHDIPYLQEQCEKYKHHELAQEILRACGRLIFRYASNEQKEELERLMKNRDIAHESVMEEVRFKVYQKKYDEALAMTEGLVKKIEIHGLFTDDSVSEYHCFNDFFEEALYSFFAKPKKTIRHAAIPFADIYLMHGTLLVEMNRLDEAQEALKKALHWNPANTNIAFEYAETYKMKGDIESFFHITVMTFQYAFRPNQVARCYRNLGYYFIEKRLWKEATACFMMSLEFEKDSKSAMSELFYIHEKAGDVEQPDMEDIRKFAEKYGFPVGAHKDVVGMAFSYGKHFWEEKNIEAARYCWEIAYALTDDKNIKKMLDALPQNSNNN